MIISVKGYEILMRPDDEITGKYADLQQSNAKTVTKWI